MAGNSRRKGAIRKRASGNPSVGSGGQVRRKLEGKGPTPPAEQRPGHKAYRAARAAAKRAETSQHRERGGSGVRGSGRARGDGERPEWIVGRNPVVEALRAGVPARVLQVAERIDRDERVREALRLSSGSGVPLAEVPRTELDRVASGAAHQGLALQISAYDYADPDELLADAEGDAEGDAEPVFVALDGVTDPRNLGAVVRSAAGFGARGVLVPERRSASMSAAAWKTSAGAALRVPVARAVNLTRMLKAYQKAGFLIVGLDAAGETRIAAVQGLSGPVVIVVGGEGRGLSRLVAESCDVLATIPMAAGTESLNASVAAGIALYETARVRTSR